MTRTDYLAFKQAYPKKPIVAWEVRIDNVVYYENNNVSLCYHFKNLHSLTKAVVKAKY